MLTFSAARVWLIAGSLLILLSMTSCRFKFPSAVEGNELKQSGVFTGSVPAWINQNEDPAPSPVATGGNIPQTYKESPTVRSSRETVPSAAGRASVGVKQRLEDAKKEKEAKLQSSGTDSDSADKSPLLRVEDTCPGSEAAVTAALTEENQSARVAKYESLTSRCPESIDLWLWLGKAYDSGKQYADAMKAYDRALLLDPSNDEAKGLKAESRRRLLAR
jgi:tetratricopeptide (TPR) repeat protein